MSVYDKDGTILNTVYDVDGDEIVSVYDVNGNLLETVIFDDSTTITNIFTSSSTAQPQGGCMDADGNVVSIFYRTGEFRSYNVSTGIETVYSTFGYETYGHANGMTYNPNTGYFYIASQNNTGEVYVLDDSFQLVETLIAKKPDDTVFNCWNICYDRISQRFITVSGNNLYFINDDWEIVDTKSFVKNDWATTRQDIETDGEFIYCVSWSPNKLFVFTMNGTLVKEISNTGFGGEPEAICYDWDTGNFYVEGKDTYYVIRQAVFKE